MNTDTSVRRCASCRCVLNQDESHPESDCFYGQPTTEYAEAVTWLTVHVHGNITTTRHDNVEAAWTRITQLCADNRWRTEGTRHDGAFVDTDRPGPLGRYQVR